MFCRILSVFLCFCMLAGSVSSMVYAMETDQGIEIKEEVAGEKSAESVLSISENTLDKASKQSVEMLLADSLDIELTLDTEVTTTIKDQNTEVWLKYHVQGDGYYNLSCLFQGARGEVYACMNTKEFYEGYAYAWADQEDYVMLYAHQNDIIYYRMYAEADNITVNATVNYVDSTDLIAAEEGIYSGTAGGYTLTALPRPEYGSAEIDVHVTTENEQLLKGEIYSIFSQNNNYISDITTIGPEKYYTTLNVGTMEPLKINTAYTMQILLQNLEGKTLAVFDGVKFTTKNADQEVIFEIKELTYDSVTILYDNLMGIDHAFYGREGTTEREYLQEGTRTYGPLHAGTKYRIWYEDFDGNILGETSFTTPDMTLRVAEASIEVTGTSTAKIKVNVDAYTGNSENLTLYYVWENAESGPWSQYKTVDVTTDANGVKSAVVEAEITDLLADTAYEIMAWVQEDSDPFSIKHHSFTREITTWKEENAKNVILSAAQSVYDPTSIEYVLNAQVATEEPIDIYYRIKNASNERAWSVYMSTYIGNETTVCRGIIPNCTIGVEYEVKIVFPRLGIYRIASCVMGEDNYHPVMTEDVDVFEANLIYTLPETEATEEDIWTVSVGYLGEDLSNSFRGDTLPALTKENGYRVSMNTLKDGNVILEPGKTCSFVWYLYKNGELCDVTKQTVTTKELKVTLKENSIGVSGASYLVDISARKEYLTKPITLGVALESAGIFHKGIIWINFDAAKDPMQPLQLDNLIPNREYNLTIKYEEQAITSTKFTTKKEDRTLTVLELEPYEKSVDMVGNLTGTISETSKACVHMYFREKGKKLWGLGEHTAWSFSEPGRFYMKIDKLKENTIYEYRIGMANSAGTTAEFLTQVKEGEIRTKGETEIQIKDYVIAKEGQSGVPEIVTGSVSCYEDDSLSGYGLYGRTSDGALIKLENVTLSVEKSLVANWNTSKLTAESRLRANSAGTTEVYFEYQGIRAVMNIIVLRKTKAFGLIGVTTNREEYPAILGEDGTYEVALKEGVGYKILGEFLPKQTFDASLFTWTSSDTKIATVDQGMVAPKAAGKVTITATAVDKNAGYIQNSSTIDLVIKKVPETGEDVPSVYAVINTKKNMVLEDVAFPKEWGEGWKWKNPKTVLYALPTNTGGYLFEACYTGEDMYSYEGNVNVYISQVDSVGAYEVDGTHNGILEVSEESAGWKDTLYLKVSETHMGKLPANYRLKLPEVEGLSVIYDKVKDRYAVTAKEAGNYVLTPVMEFFEINEKTGETYVAATIAGKYSLQAVKDKQVANIQIVSEDPSVIVEEDGGLIRLNFTEELKDKKITLSAIVTDKNANQISTPLIWTTSDESVVAVAYDKKASHQATITIKGMGHALVKVTASDAAKCEAKLNVEIRDYKPRINTNKTTVNLAYDYRENGGKKIAYDNYGAVELTEVYGRRIKSVGLKNADGREETRFVISEYTLQQGKREYIILPAKEDIPKTKYNSQLEVTIEGEDETYVYPLEITVVDKMPKVTAKIGTKINLFYLTKKGDIVLKTDSNAVIKKVSWIDSSTHEGGFEIESSVSWDNKVKGYKTSVSHNDVKVKNRKLTDTSLAKGTLMVELEGVKNPIIFKNFKIGYQYKKPTLKAVSSTTNIATLTGNTTARFTIYDSLNKETLNYDKEGKQSYHYNELAYSSNSVQAAPEGSNVYTRYFGQKTQETVSYTLNSDAWREPLAVKQTIKVVQPKAKLERSTLIYNKVYPGTETTAVLIGNISSLEEASWMDIEVVGDKKSKVLVEKDILDITRTGSADSPIAITLNRTKLLELEEEQDLKEGSYNFKVTPYYRDLSSGKKAKLNTLSLKIKIVDKPITVKVTAKGNLDITKSFLLSSKDNAVYLQTKFSNIGNNYKIIEAELRGEYSQYFKLIRKSESQDNSNDYYLQIAEYGKVKAGQNYKLSVVYKLQNAGGDIIKVESNVFCIKPKQSVPPITVSGNNQTLYAASDITREYTISVPDSYVIEKVSGGLDCNKDGKTDIAVEIASIHGNAAVVKVYLKDAYAVVATTKGKSYNIPFQVQLLGRDGLSKDVKVTGKVQVRR